MASTANPPAKQKHKAKTAERISNERTKQKRSRALLSPRRFTIIALLVGSGGLQDRARRSARRGARARPTVT